MTSSPSSRVSSLIYENAAVGHQLGVDRNDMLAPGNVKQKHKKENDIYHFFV